MMRTKKEISPVITAYVKEMRKILGNDFHKAYLYGSYARNEFTEDSDIDIAIFTDRPSNEFYLLINKIAELTFDYNVKYDLILSPVFQNETEYQRMLKVVPYFQNIQKEGIAIG